MFKEDEAGFLVGIIAGQVTVSKKLHVIAGAEIPAVIRYVNG
jgi:basic membrane lipoprotein Med (substrate-binding protein (PBP1-ABC) superfamily)